MKSLRRTFVLFTIFLILSSSTSSFEVVAPTSGHVVINEFELNPPGNDNYLNVEEWVELYNPTSESIDISGWTLSTIGGETVTVSIPEGIMVDANGYYVFRRGSQWLDNNAEAVILRDAEGEEVDRTPARSDGDNDDYSWARYSNGQDTDSDTDWRFQSSTEGASNGGESSPPPEPEPEPLPTLTPSPPLTPPTENVTVHFINVGQGDAIFVDTPTLDMLVDGGSRAAGETVVDYLQELNVTRIDIVVATHPHADHIGGLITVLTEYSTSQIPLVIDSGYEATTVTYRDYITLVGQRTFQTAARGDSLTLDESVYVTILNPTSPVEFDDANDNSVVLLLQVYNVTFLLTGDSEAISEASILAAGFDQRYTVLKVGHHGSRTSTSPAYLEAIDPDVAVISVGEGNRYDHPHQETLDKLAAEGLTVYRTDLHGTVEITTDGIDYSVRTEELDPSETTSEPELESESEPAIPGFNPYNIAAGIILALAILQMMSERNQHSL